ncbi:MAG: hypothetical protein IIT51_03995, partial [Oscillospiraceae bacterium]|nr:hypothetical protein [Oscillospiraceae bacterium]
RERTYWAELLIGLLIWCLFRFVPALQLITTVITMPLAVGVFRRLLIKKEKNKTGRKGRKGRKDADEEDADEVDEDDEVEEIIERSKGGRSSETSTQRRGRHELKS